MLSKLEYFIVWERFPKVVAYPKAFAYPNVANNASDAPEQTNQALTPPSGKSSSAFGSGETPASRELPAIDSLHVVSPKGSCMLFSVSDIVKSLQLFVRYRVSRLKL
jgi:hypothetical protein